ncbi:hypothetical protein CBM2586_A50005 [Cupriavidus phytorum]|uniref:Uncharacterized protein n=1 Tax=Cupriavidus taiwanensis TaxID=164546 RepID=A0A976A4X3_9BURK|nr:hypothetical protein CBM2586_A50005 [Cupriavidus taiwanensis]
MPHLLRDHCPKDPDFFNFYGFSLNA